MTKTKGRINIKFDVNCNYEDPSSELLNQLVDNINEYLPLQDRLSNPVIDNKYINFDYVYYFEYDSTEYVSGLIAGYLMAKGFEIL